LATCIEPGCYNKDYFKNQKDCEALILHSCECVNNKCQRLENQFDTSGWQTYQNKKGGFELNVPAKWDFYERISSTAGGVDLFLFFDKEATTSIDEYDYVQLNIRIKQNKLNLSMEDFYNGEQNADLFRNARSGYSEIMVGGKDAVRFKEKDDIGADIVIIPLQNKFIEIDSANSDMEMFNKILPTFKFIELIDTSNWQTYQNEEFGFEVILLDSWAKYSVLTESWDGISLDNNSTKYEGPKITIRNPNWSDNEIWQDIPILVFTKDEWQLIEQRNLNISAAPVGPKKLGENKEYIFALPPRWAGFSDALGQNEAQEIIKTFKAISLIADWQTYRNEEFGFELKYPKE